MQAEEAQGKQISFVQIRIFVIGYLLEKTPAFKSLGFICQLRTRKDLSDAAFFVKIQTKSRADG